MIKRNINNGNARDRGESTREEKFERRIEFTEKQMEYALMQYKGARGPGNRTLPRIEPNETVTSLLSFNFVQVGYFDKRKRERENTIFLAAFNF